LCRPRRRRRQLSDQRPFGKEQLLFVAYDETRSVPVDLVRLAAQSGCTAQIVDL
jgi:hypothetical protein